MKYYVSILVESEDKLVVKNDNKKVLGIDFSMGDNFCVMSDGTKPKFQKHYYNSQKNLAKHQRRLSKKVLDSKNYQKQILKVAKISQHTTNQRKDFVHKLSYSISENYDVVVIEDINLQYFAKHKNWGKRIKDSGFGMFKTCLSYKLKERGKELVIAHKFFASSQLCSSCGYKNTETKDLTIREWKCPSCGKTHDRDINASVNLMKYYKVGTT